MVIGSIGVGLLVLIILWIITLTVFVIGIKFQNNVAWIVLGSAAFLTTILVLIPLENQNKSFEETDVLEKDYDFIYRVLLLSFLIISALIGFGFFFILHCIEPVRVKPVK